MDDRFDSFGDEDPFGGSGSGPKANLNFFEFWYCLISRPTHFFENYFNNNTSPYFGWVLIIFGVSSAIDRIEQQFVKYDLRGDLEQLALLNNWVAFWGFAFAAGLIGGLLYYYLGGWWYNVRVGWAGGEKDDETSRFLYMYSFFLPSAINFIMTVGLTVVEDKPYDPDAPIYIRDLVFLGMMIIAAFWSIYISYAGVTVLMKTSKIGGLIWFVILPGLIYLLAFGVLVSLTAVGFMAQ